MCTRVIIYLYIIYGVFMCTLLRLNGWRMVGIYVHSNLSGGKNNIMVKKKIKILHLLIRPRPRFEF